MCQIFNHFEFLFSSDTFWFEMSNRWTSNYWHWREIETLTPDYAFEQQLENKFI